MPGVGQIIRDERRDLSASEQKGEQGVLLDGAELHVDVTGNGDALLLIHAGVADSRMWDRQVEEFSKEYRVIRCDLRGFGRSRMSVGAFAYHDDIAALLRHLDVERATVIGASFGGSVALDFALAYADMVNALVLVSPAVGGYEFESSQVLAFFTAEDDALERGDVEAATELNLKMWVDGPNRSAGAVSGEIRELVRDMQMNIFSQPDVENVEVRELYPPAVGRLHELKIPTLVIVGEKDVAEFQGISRRIARNVSNAKHVVMSGVAHLPSMEKPEEFNRIVREFLERIHHEERE